MNQDEEFKQQIQANDADEQMFEFAQYKQWKDEHDPNKPLKTTFCPICEKETVCTHVAELYECEECGEDFAKHIVGRTELSKSDVSVTENALTFVKTSQSNEMENPKMTLKVTVDPYVEIFYGHIKDLNTAIDRLCPLVARAITKVTPPSIGRENTADFDLARAMREALDELTKVQNREYRDPNSQELLDTSTGSEARE